MAIYITGDTHGSIDIARLNTKRFKEGKNLNKNDYVIILGDFGVVWNNKNETAYWLNWLDEKPFTTLFIDGNHENFSELYKYPIETWNGGKIHKLNDSVFHLQRGQVYTINQKKFFTFGGAMSYDIFYRLPEIDWWKEELPNKVEENEGLSNLEKHYNNVDYILTHECPENVFEILKHYYKYIKLESYSLKKYLKVISNLVNFKHWYFGHYHKDLKVAKKFTVVYEKFIKLED